MLQSVAPTKSAPALESLFRAPEKLSIQAVNETITPELVIALCGPIGSPLHIVAERLKHVANSQFHYTSRVVCLSQFIENHLNNAPPNEKHFDRVQRLIKGGDDMRRDCGGSILADFAINNIHSDRIAHLAKLKDIPEEEAAKAEHFPPRRTCHIIDSIKNHEELKMLRLVYRDMFYCIGVLSPLSLRLAYLSDRGLDEPDIYRLIDRDSGEEVEHGQRVRDTFPQADFFLGVANRNLKEMDLKLERFLSIVLGTDVVTPSLEEQAMYQAAAAAVNSACLSRQVGAAVTDSELNILGVGWNDVPMVGGNLYRTGKTPDHRCINIDGGKCFNDEEKRELREDIVVSLIKKNLLSELHRDEAVRALKESRVKDLLEFSRSIHAEMHAIIIASQRTGDAMVGGSIFCTTYPCHSCARHIIAAGIKNFYYIEPYRKSLATDLHKDAISESEDARDKVRLLPFDGVAPNRFMELFAMLPDSRKSDGQMRVSERNSAMQKSKVSMEALPVLETAVISSLVKRELINIPIPQVEAEQHETHRSSQRATSASAD